MALSPRNAIHRLVLQERSVWRVAQVKAYLSAYLSRGVVIPGASVEFKPEFCSLWFLSSFSHHSQVKVIWFPHSAWPIKTRSAQRGYSTNCLWPWQPPLFGISCPFLSAESHWEKRGDFISSPPFAFDCLAPPRTNNGEGGFIQPPIVERRVR